MATLTGSEFFPNLISGPFHHGLVVVFGAAALMMLVAASASMFDASGRLARSHEDAGERLGEEDDVLTEEAIA